MHERMRPGWNREGETEARGREGEHTRSEEANPLKEETKEGEEESEKKLREVKARDDFSVLNISDQELVSWLGPGTGKLKILGKILHIDPLIDSSSFHSISASKLKFVDIQL
jgi:hypothetical protein